VWREGGKLVLDPLRTPGQIVLHFRSQLSQFLHQPQQDVYRRPAPRPAAQEAACAGAAAGRGVRVGGAALGPARTGQAVFAGDRDKAQAGVLGGERGGLRAVVT
jgi:hypothetical protein